MFDYDENDCLILKSYWCNENIIGEYRYYKKGIEGIHRDDGPAIIKYSNKGILTKEYYIQHDLNHRVDGPAVIDYNEDGSIKKEQYFLMGVEITSDMFNWFIDKNMSPLEIKNWMDFDNDLKTEFLLKFKG